MRNAELDRFIGEFYGAFDNRNGRVPTREGIADLFVKNAVILSRAGGETTESTVEEFTEPRVTLLTSGRLREFSERERESSTRIFEAFAVRISEYSKSGRMDSLPYEGEGTKLFQLAHVGGRWRIVSLCWFDRSPDPPPTCAR